MKIIAPNTSPTKNLAMTVALISTLFIKPNTRLVKIALNNADIIMTNIRNL